MQATRSSCRATLRYVVEEMRQEGAQDVQAPVKVGGKWLASFDHPGWPQGTVEKIGFEIIIEGPHRGKRPRPIRRIQGAGSADRPRARAGGRRLETLPR